MLRSDPVPIIVVGDFLDSGKIYAYEEGSGVERMVLLDLNLEQCAQGARSSTLAELIQAGRSIRNQRFRVHMKADGTIMSWSVLQKDAQPEVSA